MDKLNQPIPLFRRDLDIQVVKDPETDLVVLSDPLGFAPEPVVITMPFYYLLCYCDGKKSALDLAVDIEAEVGQKIDIVPIYEQIEFMAKCGFLETPEIVAKKQEDFSEYGSLNERPPICADGSYPSDPEELKKELAEILDSYPQDGINGKAQAIIVPHIDFRIGKEAHKVYAAGYRALDLDGVDTVIVFGTAHHANSDYFMLTEKDYATPLGTIPTDREIINSLRNKLPHHVVIDERAHRFEHSIELQAVLLNYIAGGRIKTILPILAGSVNDHISAGSYPEVDPGYSAFLELLVETLEEAGKKYACIASVDFAHIGRKFGDDFDAEPMLEELKEEDAVLIRSLVNCDQAGFLEKIRSDSDKWKICGTAPIYAMLTALNPRKGVYLNYGRWNETEAKSAVSFASLAFYK